MNIYKITLDEYRKINPVEHHVLAENFLDAVEQAKKIAAKVYVRNSDLPDDEREAEILTVEKLFTIETVK